MWRSKPDEGSGGTSSSIDGFVQDLVSGELLSSAADYTRSAFEVGSQTVADAAAGVRRSVLEALDIEDSKPRRALGRSTWQAPFWSQQGPGERVPMPVDDPQRLILALFALGRTAVEEYSSDEDVLQPVTVVLVAVNLLAFLYPGGLLLHRVCLTPARVLEHGEWSRLLTSAVVHRDAAHLASNLAAVLPECLYLERRPHGSALLLLDLALTTLLSSGLFVGLAMFQRSARRQGGVYHSSAIGLSSVAMALQVIAGHQRNCKVAVLGLVPMPSQYAWVPSLALTTLCAPSASLAGHACGVAAGVLRAYIIGPAVRLAVQGLKGARPGGAPARVPGRPAGRSGTFWGSGTTGGRRLEPLAAQRPPRRAALYRWARELGMQVALLAGTVTLLATVGRKLADGGSSRQRPAGQWQFR